jgi:dsDNA-binding SOS-regulon protein
MTGYESKKAMAQAKVEGPIHVVCQCDKCKAAAQDKMATNNETLVKRLRNTASRGVSVWGDLMLEAADALEQPAQRPWVGLTEEEQSALVLKYGDTPVALCLETERKLKEMNNAT